MMSPVTFTWNCCSKGEMQQSFTTTHLTKPNVLIRAIAAAFLNNAARGLLAGLPLALIAHLSLAQAAAPGAILLSGQSAVPAGTQATFTGRNFEPGETVTFCVTHLRGTATVGTNHTPAQVIADPAGSFTATWLVCSNDCAGEMLQVEGTGQTSGLVGRAVFLDLPAPPARPTTWVRTDKADYAPGTTARITGAGFGAGETVVLQVGHADGTPDSGADHEPWSAIADASGGYQSTWHVCTDDCLHSTLRLTAAGQTSGRTAQAIFTDAGGAPTFELLKSFGTPSPGGNVFGLVQGPGCGYFSRDDRRISVFGSRRDFANICEIDGGREWRGLYPDSGARVEGVTCEWTSDGRQLVSRHTDGLRLWDTVNGRERPFPMTDVQGMSDLAFVGSGSNWVAATGTGLCSWSVRHSDATSDTPWTMGERQEIRPDIVADRVALSDDGSILAATVQRTLRIFKWPGGEDLRTFRLENSVYGWALSPRGRYCMAWPWVAGWAAKGPRRVWEIATGAVVKEFPLKTIYGAAFSPDDQWLITGDDKEYVMYDTGSWSNVWTLARENSAAAHARIAFTQDGRVGALTLSARTVRLFEPATGRELATLEAPDPQSISWLAFSPDGGRLAATTMTSVIHLWDLRLIRQELAAMKLDWENPSLAAEIKIADRQRQTGQQQRR
jgi:WD40 repeat protein